VGSETLPIFSALILGSKFWGIGVGGGSLPQDQTRYTAIVRPARSALRV